jgi:opacity protein-like surface antigen
MKITSLTTLAAAGLLSATPALAGSLDDPIVSPEPPKPVAVDPAPTGPDWTGFYAGGSLGYADATDSTFVTDEFDGLTYGVHAGYDRDFGGAVLGGELELSGFDVEDPEFRPTLEIDSILRAKLRAGYNAGNWLPYLTAGVAQLTTSGNVDDSDTGSFYGVGVDYRVGDDIRVGAEVLDHQFDDFASSNFDFDVTTVSARVSFEF